MRRTVERRAPDSEKPPRLQVVMVTTAAHRHKVIARLRELIAALDRRHPQTKCPGEQLIASDAAALRRRAQERIADLETARPCRSARDRWRGEAPILSHSTRDSMAACWRGLALLTFLATGTTSGQNWALLATAGVVPPPLMLAFWNDRLRPTSVAVARAVWRKS